MHKSIFSLWVLLSLSSSLYANNPSNSTDSHDNSSYTAIKAKAIEEATNPHPAINISNPMIKAKVLEEMAQPDYPAASMKVNAMKVKAMEKATHPDQTKPIDADILVQKRNENESQNSSSSSEVNDDTNDSDDNNDIDNTSNNYPSNTHANTAKNKSISSNKKDFLRTKKALPNCKNPSTITCQTSKLCKSYGYDTCDMNLNSKPAYGYCSYSACAEIQAAILNSQ